ncbi:hypothetical protein C8J56DRAFT_795209 [Mycena floridula]|nr:hypothetical protein C8J56DRAFT_795209 [Mycena floridula]
MRGAGIGVKYVYPTESMHQIWKLRCNVVVDGDKIQSERHIECAWSAAINSRLEEDQMLTNAFWHQGNALSKDIVLETWSGTLKNQNSLPADWIRLPEVLVGIGQQGDTSQR